MTEPLSTQSDPARRRPTAPRRYVVREELVSVVCYEVIARNKYEAVERMKAGEAVEEYPEGTVAHPGRVLSVERADA